MEFHDQIAIVDRMIDSEMSNSRLDGVVVAVGRLQLHFSFIRNHMAKPKVIHKTLEHLRSKRFCPEISKGAVIVTAVNFQL